MTRARNLTQQRALVVTPLCQFTEPWWTIAEGEEWEQAFEDFRDICAHLEINEATAGLLAHSRYRRMRMSTEAEAERWYRLAPVLPDGYTSHEGAPPWASSLSDAAVAFMNRDTEIQGKYAGERILAGDPWDGTLSEWEAQDAPANGWDEHSTAWYLRERTETVVMPTQIWDELRGLKECGDASRFVPEDTIERRANPGAVVQVFLGWPAYLLAAASEAPARCRQCGGPVVSGREYCRTDACDKARNTIRQRESRAARSRSPERLVT